MIGFRKRKIKRVSTHPPVDFPSRPADPYPWIHTCGHKGRGRRPRAVRWDEDKGQYIALTFCPKCRKKRQRGSAIDFKSQLDYYEKELAKKGSGL